MKSNLYSTLFHLSKMDCSSEEAMVRMKLEDVKSVKLLEFDLERRDVKVIHAGESIIVEKKLQQLDLGVSLISSKEVSEETLVESKSVKSDAVDRKRLWYVLIINFSFFVIEMSTGIITRSMGLVADSLDMLADALVYSLSLWAVGAAISRKKRVATLSGYFQATLAFIGLFEVVRRFFISDEVPDYRLMIVVSILALIANSVSLFVIRKSKNSGVHMKASVIFTANDVIINSGVILAGIMVMLTNSKYPDLIIGGVVFLIVIRGAVRILKLGRWRN